MLESGAAAAAEEKKAADLKAFVRMEYDAVSRKAALVVVGIIVDCWNPNEFIRMLIYNEMSENIMRN